MEAFSPSPGLRERKKQKTRDTIITVALERFAEQGYEHTTIAEIADAAEVSPRTIFAYFPSKEDIVFYDQLQVQENLARALRERPEGATALDALREFIFGIARSGQHSGASQVRHRGRRGAATQRARPLRPNRAADD